MAKVPQSGQVLSLKDAQTQLTDTKGNLLEFKEQDDGSFKSNEIEGDGYIYSYDLIPQTAIVTVYANKVKKEDKKKASKEEEKAIKDAETVAENAPDNKTKKEAEKVASYKSKY